jgi:hypothetical protein
MPNYTVNGKSYFFGTEIGQEAAEAKVKELFLVVVVLKEKTSILMRTQKMKVYYKRLPRELVLV